MFKIYTSEQTSGRRMHSSRLAWLAACCLLIPSEAIQCVAGTFKAAQGDASCEQCTANLISPAGSTHADDCVCARPLMAPEPCTEQIDTLIEGTTYPCAFIGGFPLLDRENLCTVYNKCEVCPCSCACEAFPRLPTCPCEAGKYKHESGSGTCTICPANSVSLEGSTDSSDCVCKVGYPGPDGGPCVAGAVECTAGQTADCYVVPVEAFQCPPGAYVSGAAVCSACPDGTWKDGTHDGTSCWSENQCPGFGIPGSIYAFQSNEDKTRCHVCDDKQLWCCAGGRYAYDIYGGHHLQGVCEWCDHQAGRYKDGVNAYSAQWKTNGDTCMECPAWSEHDLVKGTSESFFFLGRSLQRLWARWVDTTKYDCGGSVFTCIENQRRCTVAGLLCDCYAVNIAEPGTTWLFLPKPPSLSLSCLCLVFVCLCLQKAVSNSIADTAWGPLISQYIRGMLCVRVVRTWLQFPVLL